MLISDWFIVIYVLNFVPWLLDLRQAFSLDDALLAFAQAMNISSAPEESLAAGPAHVPILENLFEAVEQSKGH